MTSYRRQQYLATYKTGIARRRGRTTSIGQFIQDSWSASLDWGNGKPEKPILLETRHTAEGIQRSYGYGSDRKVTSVKLAKYTSKQIDARITRSLRSDPSPNNLRKYMRRYPERFKKGSKFREAHAGIIRKAVKAYGKGWQQTDVGKTFMDEMYTGKRARVVKGTYRGATTAQLRTQAEEEKRRKKRIARRRKEANMPGTPAFVAKHMPALKHIGVIKFK